MITEKTITEKTEKDEDLDLFHSIMEDVGGDFIYQTDEPAFDEEDFAFFDMLSDM